MSNSLFAYINKLFKKQEQKSTRGNPVIHEQLSRDDKYVSEYNLWQRKETSSNYLTWLQKQYESYAEGNVNFDDDVEFLNTPSKKGIIIYNKGYHNGNLPYLFDLLRDRVKEEGYILNVSDRKVFHKNDIVKTIERYYLKPRLQMKKEGANQRFGNIEIDMNYNDDELKYLKVGVTTYNDRQYAKATSIDSLYSRLFRYLE